VRDLKFRTWDNIFKRWIDVYEIRLARNGNPLCVVTLDGEQYGLHQAELMQYTGLLDKQGVECYWDDWVTDGINPKFLVTPDYHLLARLSEITFEIIGNKYEA